VAANVIEGVEFPVLATHQQDALPQHVAGEIISRLGHLLVASNAEPLAEEDTLLFLPEELRREVR
jgi:hypothetical protein